MRKIKQVFVVVCILTVLYSLYNIGSSFLADVDPMTDEQYARAAQDLVNRSLMPCQSSADISTENQ